MFLWLTSRSLAVDLGVVELGGCYSFYAEGFEYVGLVEPFFHFVYGGSFEELGRYEGWCGRSCIRLSSFARVYDFNVEVSPHLCYRKVWCGYFSYCFAFLLFWGILLRVVWVFRFPILIRQVPDRCLNVSLFSWRRAWCIMFTLRKWNFRLKIRALGKITAKTGTTIAYKNGLKVMEISAQAAFFSTNVKYWDVK